MHIEAQKAHRQARALRPTCEFPHMTHRATLMMGSLCSMRFATMPQKIRGLGHFIQLLSQFYHKIKSLRFKVDRRVLPARPHQIRRDQVLHKSFAFP